MVMPYDPGATEKAENSFVIEHCYLALSGQNEHTLSGGRCLQQLADC